MEAVTHLKRRVHVELRIGLYDNPTKRQRVRVHCRQPEHPDNGSIDKTPTSPPRRLQMPSAQTATLGMDTPKQPRTVPAHRNRVFCGLGPRRPYYLRVYTVSVHLYKSGSVPIWASTVPKSLLASAGQPESKEPPGAYSIRSNATRRIQGVDRRYLNLVTHAMSVGWPSRSRVPVRRNP